MLNGEQFQPHEFMDVQDEGLYVGRQLIRTARVYREDHERPLGDGTALRSYTAMVPMENGWHAKVGWLESSDRRHNTVHLRLAAPAREQGEPPSDAKAALQRTQEIANGRAPGGSVSAMLHASSPEEFTDVLGQLGRAKAPHAPAQETRFEQVAREEPWPNMERLR